MGSQRPSCSTFTGRDGRATMTASTRRIEHRSGGQPHPPDSPVSPHLVRNKSCTLGTILKSLL